MFLCVVFDALERLVFKYVTSFHRHFLVWELVVLVCPVPITTILIYVVGCNDFLVIFSTFLKLKKIVPSHSNEHLKTIRLLRKQTKIQTKNPRLFLS